jgi:hypothetical protein
VEIPVVLVVEPVVLMQFPPVDVEHLEHPDKEIMVVKPEIFLLVAAPRVEVVAVLVQREVISVVHLLGVEQAQVVVVQLHL